MAIEAKGYQEPVTHFLYWQNRETRDRIYLDLNLGLSEMPLDLYGDVEGPKAEVLTQLFNSLILSGPVPSGTPENMTAIPEKVGH